MPYINSLSASSKWNTGTSGLRIGRDVARNMSTSFSAHSGPATSTLADGSDVTFKSTQLYNDAKSMAMRGGKATSFKTADLSGSASLNKDEGVTIAQKGDYKVTYGGKNSDQLSILKKNTETGKYDVIATIDSSKDAKISWGDSGEPTLLTGSSALTGGKLTATGKDDILFRASKADVQAGDGTTVFNVSSAHGNFSGGSNVTYLGSYEGASFSESEGNIDFAGFFKDSTFAKLTGINTYDGVFEDVDIDSDKSKGTFSGYFSNSQITADKKEIEASGLFLETTIKGSNKGDNYSGRFITSEVDAGNGADTFGNTSYTEGKEQRSRDPNIFAEEYEGIEADFIDSQVNTGSGDSEFRGVMWGGNLDLTAGKNTVSGVFAKSSVSGGTGDDTISAEYSRSSTFSTGSGKNTITLTTSVESNVIAEDGSDNKISMGANNTGIGDASWQTSQDILLNERATIAGELKSNTIDIAKGENETSVQNGESTVKATSGDSPSNPLEKKEENISETEESSVGSNDTNSTSEKRNVNKMANRYSQISGLNPQESQGTAAIITTSKEESVEVKEAEREDDAPIDLGSETETMMMVNAFGNVSGKKFKVTSV